MSSRKPEAAVIHANAHKASNKQNIYKASPGDVINQGSFDLVFLKKAGSVSFTNVATVVGTKGSDTFTSIGTVPAPISVTIFGNGGLDTFNMGAGQTFVLYGSGTVNGSSGNESLVLSSSPPVGGLPSRTHIDNSYNLTVNNVEVINGSTANGNDTITYTDNTTANINLGSGNDKLQLGNGGQTVTVANIESITGGSGNDIITYTTNTTATVNGGLGNDTLNLADGGQTVTVADIETINGGNGNDLLTLASGGQIVTVADIETINGGSGNDTITYTTNTTATINGNGGNDTLNLADGGQTVSVANVETINGGGGNDTITYTTTTTATVDGGGGNDTLNLKDGGQIVTVANIETVNGGNGADTITYTTNTTATINGGGAGDTLTLADGGQTVTVADVETITGGTGDDTITYTTNTTATVDGDAGLDTLNLKDGGQTVTVANIETINGGDGDDTITYTATGGVTATINGGAGDDSLSLANGGQTVTVADVETVTGGTGNDTITYTTTTTATIDGGLGDDTLSLANGGQTVTVSNVETVNGGDGDDTIIYLTSTAASITGAAGDDVIVFHGDDLTSADTVDGGIGSNAINIDSEGSVDLTNVTNIQNLNLGYDDTSTAITAGTYTVTLGAGSADLNINATYSDETGDAYTVNLGSTTVIGSSFVNVIGSSADDNNFVALQLDSGGGNHVNVTNLEVVFGGGSGDVVDGSTSTKGFDYYDGGLGESVTGGSGDDSFTYLATDLDPTAPFLQTIVGGDGNDVLNVNSAGLAFGSEITLANVTGVETVNLDDGFTFAYITTAGFDGLLQLGVSDSHFDPFLLTGATTDNSNDIAFVDKVDDLTIDGGVGGADDSVTFGDFANTATLAGVESIYGGAEDDKLTIVNDPGLKSSFDAFTTVGAGAGDSTIEGGAGNDQITITGATGQQTLVFENTGVYDATLDPIPPHILTGANGTDVITGFHAGVTAGGVAGDVLDFSLFGITSAHYVVPVGTANPTVPVDINGAILKLIDQPLGDDITTETGLMNALNQSNGEYRNFDFVTGDDHGSGHAVILTASSGTTNQIEVFDLTSQGNGHDVGTVTLVATLFLDPGQNINTFDVHNFV